METAVPKSHQALYARFTEVLKGAETSARLAKGTGDLSLARDEIANARSDARYLESLIKKTSDKSTKEKMYEGYHTLIDKIQESEQKHGALEASKAGGTKVFRLAGKPESRLAITDLTRVRPQASFANRMPGFREL